MPDGRVEIYEEPGTLGLRVPTLMIKQIREAQEQALRKMRLEQQERDQHPQCREKHEADADDHADSQA